MRADDYALNCRLILISCSHWPIKFDDMFVYFEWAFGFILPEFSRSFSYDLCSIFLGFFSINLSFDIVLVIRKPLFDTVNWRINVHYHRGCNTLQILAFRFMRTKKSKNTCDAPLRREAPEIGDGFGVTIGVVGSDTLTSISVGCDSRLIVFDGGGVEASVSSSHGPISSIVMSSCDWGDSVLIVTCWANGASLTAILSFIVDGETR